MNKNNHHDRSLNNNSLNNNLNNLNIDINKLENVTCPNCNHKFFSKKFIMKKIPKLLIGETEDRVILLEAIVCENCNYSL